MGLVDSQRYKQFKETEDKYKKFVNNKLKKTKLKSFINNKNKKVNLTENKNVFELLSRTDVNTKKLLKTDKETTALFERAATESKYSGYIQKQLREIAKTKKQNNKKIPQDLNYSEIKGLSNEVKEKLNKNKPETIGTAAQIEGVTPAAINLIIIQLKKTECIKT